MTAADGLVQRVRDELRYEPGVDERRIRIGEEDGVVTLDGEVDSISAAELANHAVFRVEGVRALINRLEIRSPSAPAPTRLEDGGPGAARGPSEPARW
jgi:osmotically-inducible protein OsmY